MPGKDQQVSNQTQTQSSSTAPWAAAQPLLTKLISQYGGLDTGVTGGQQSALDNLVSSANGIPNFGAQGSEALNKLFSTDTSPQVGMLTDAFKSLQGNLGATASGANLDPYATPGFGDAIRTATQDITNQVKGVYAGSGRDPSGAGSFAGSLGRGLTQGLAPTIASQFNTNNQNMINANNTLFGAAGNTASGITQQQQQPLLNAATALGLTPQVSQAYTNPASTQYAAATQAYQAPWTNLAQLLQAGTTLGGMGSQSTGTGTGTSTTIQPQSTLSNVIGGASAGIGLLSLLSDERAKDEIEPIGKLNDGQEVVRFRYKGDDTMRIGLLAQDVAKRVPSAVSEMGGLLAVDHRRATERAAAIGRAA